MTTLTLTPALLHMALSWKAKAILKEKEMPKQSKGLHGSPKFLCFRTQSGFALTARNDKMLVLCTVAPVVFVLRLFTEQLLLW